MEGNSLLGSFVGKGEGSVMALLQTNAKRSVGIEFWHWQGPAFTYCFSVSWQMTCYKNKTRLIQSLCCFTGFNGQTLFKWQLSIGKFKMYSPTSVMD